MRNLLIALTLTLTTFSSIVQAKPTQNLVLVTIDGLRWQELFGGIDNNLLNNKNFVKDKANIKAKFWHESKNIRRERLMPFFWQTIAKNGVVIGNRNIGSTMSVANQWYFSYPGYSEIFTGVVDHNLNSNAKVNNPNISFLEWLNQQSGYDKKLAAFGSWDVLPYIFNTPRSQLHVNAGFMPASDYALSHEAQLLNKLQTEIPSPWHNVRLDSFTYRFAKDYLTKVKPRAMIISFGETDDFAHDGHYDSYLKSAHQTDKFIQDLWETLQSMPEYKNNTTLLITTDHGRGSNAENWQHHASSLAVKSSMKYLAHFKNGILGAEHIWFAAMGPNIKKRGEITTSREVKQKEIAATALTLLGEDPTMFNPNAAAAIKEIF